MNKKKGHRSSVKKGYYAAQFAKTDANKGRRAAKRKKKAEYWAKVNASKIKPSFLLGKPAIGWL